MTANYHYGLSGPVVWIMHIILGIFFVYFGYSSLKNIVLPDYIYIGIIVIGVLAILYHTHIWIMDKDDDNYIDNK